MFRESRFPSLIVVLGVVLLAAMIGIPAWYFTRKPPMPLNPGPSLDELDVVCNGRVDIDGSTFPLEPSQPGRIAELFVKEMAEVKKGEPILKLDDTVQQTALQEAQAAVRAVEIEIEAADYRVRQHPDQIRLQQKKVEAAEAETAAAQKQLEQLEEKAKLTKQVSQTDVETFAAKVQSGKLLVDAEKLQLEQLQKLDVTLEKKGLLAKLDRAKLAVERAEKAVRDCLLKAPVDGTILRLQVSVGASMAPGSPVPLILFAPAKPLIVRADVEQASLGRVQVGMKAIIEDDARANSPTWTGRVRSIADWVAQKRSILLEPGEINDVRTTEVIIDIDPSEDVLRIGQRMRVRIIR